MNHTSKLTALPALTTDLPQDSGGLIDHIFAELRQQIGMKTLLHGSGFTKCSAIPIHEVVYTRLRWLWLKKESIWMFARDSLQGKDVLYDTLNREDQNWRRFHERIAYKTMRSFQTTLRASHLGLSSRMNIAAINYTSNDMWASKGGSGYSLE